MFYKEKIDKLFDKIELLELRCEDIIKCRDCKCLIKREDAFKVINVNDFGFLDYYYCQKCKPDYDIIKYGKKFKNECKEIKPRK